MQDFRDSLSIRTRIKLGNASIYEISGEPIGFGGGSIIYPANRLILKDGSLVADGLTYALKECYPVSMEYSYTRNSDGEVSPRDRSEQSNFYLHRAQQFLLQEGKVSGDIYKTASRMLPIREFSEKVTLTLPGKDVPCLVANTVTVMDSLSGKGQSIRDCLQERNRFAPAEAFRIIQQLLFALREVHQAGYLHLDIQDGNIFLRGALEDKSELVTLIDFGSARTMVDGKTAPIEDRVIFTSRGFSAPEMLLCNDGTLQLTPEADIYSVGCLALYLLTGRKTESSVLLVNKTGRYLRPNDIRRMHSPRHLVDRIQEILAKALEKEPKDRYHSVDEMLEDINDLVAALQPYRTDLNTVKYDAFVCYKHGAINGKAAMTIQRKLEQFRAPKGVAHSRRPFKRVFVDEGELSSCADFGEQIREALKNAGWLIVICSPDTPNSPWVQLEIETFLEYHDRSRILALLTDGEPENSFPPQLFGRGGTDEVLAADARGTDLKEVLKKLNGDALLKIAAPMMGTTFDTLKQRQKIYMLQRIAVVAAAFLVVATGFAGYAMNRAKVIAEQAERIEEEYQNALVNESKFLTEQAEKRLADNDILGAIELALAALPSEEQDRPILPEAEAVLSRALGIYKTPSSAQLTASAEGMIETDCENFELDATGKYLFAWGDYATHKGVQIWNAESICFVREISKNNNIYDVLPAKNNVVIVHTQSGLLAYDCITGEQRWEKEAEGIRAVSLSEDLTKVAMLYGTSQHLSNEEPEDNELKVDILATNSGEVLNHLEFQIDGSQKLEYNACFSSDLKWLAIPTYDSGEYYFPYNENSVYVTNLENGICRLLLDSDTVVTHLAFQEDTLAIMRWGGGGLHFTTTEEQALASYVYPGILTLEAYDLNTFSLCWNVEKNHYPKGGSVSRIVSTQYDTGENVGEGILYTCDNVCILLDRMTGKVIRDYELDSPVADIWDAPNEFWVIAENGSLIRAGYDLDSTRNILHYVGNSIIKAHKVGEAIYIQSGEPFDTKHPIWKYRQDKFDPQYVQHFEIDDSWAVLDYRCSSEESIVVLVRDNAACLVDLTTDKAIVNEIPEQYSFSKYNVMGTSSSCDFLYWTTYGGDYTNQWIPTGPIYSIDLRTGVIQEVKQPHKPESISSVKGTVFENGKLYLCTELGESSSLGIFVWDIQSEKLNELGRYSWQDVAHLFSSSLQIDADQQRLLAVMTDGSDFPKELISIDLTNGEWSVIPIDFNPQEDTTLDSYLTTHCWSTSGAVAAFAYGKTVYLVDSEGQLIHAIYTGDEIAGIHFASDEDSVYLISHHAQITKCRLSDGVCLTEIQPEKYRRGSIGAIDQEKLRWKYLNDSTLIIFTGDDAFLLDIAGEELKMKAAVSNCFAYNPWENRLVVSNREGFIKTSIGSLPYYSLDELIQQANKLLKIH